MTPDELTRLAGAERTERARFQHQIDVCTATACQASGSELLAAALRGEVQRQGRSESCRVKGVGCPGLCAAAPLVTVEPSGTMYQRVEPADAPEIVRALGQRPVRRLALRTDIPFFTRQTRTVLENAGRIDPERIEEYVAHDGYRALLRALDELAPEEVITEITRAGLRGRGGAGYPTGLKWRTVAKGPGPRKYVICNGDEGDPGAFMDRGVLESDPHRGLEGMAVAAYAVGASLGYLYVRAEYPLAIKRLTTAIRQAKRLGVLGEAIGGTSFNFDVEIRVGAGAFVCGEETALIASIEGGRGTPRPRPPYPAESGLWGCPTLINNVETFANIAPIVRNGADWFASIGTEKSKGTKVFALTGRIQHTGLIEVPMGISLREVIYEIGGGIPEGRTFKAVQTGGPSGGCIPEEHLDIAVDYESLSRLGTIMGSGGMIVMDDTTNMVDVARYFMEFSRDESCGKCVPCRVGTVQMHELLTRFADGEARGDDLPLLEELCDMVRNTSLCGLGQAAPNPVLSTLRFFRQEYLDLIREPGTGNRPPGDVMPNPERVPVDRPAPTTT
ncbi:MAG: NAD(P)H-dependent oxidoreductase subunit E [Chloroflexi bacterium]|nr:NAD(P)H-dependent oxidoreductase subunit E [Chloroflexota bacterium]